MVLAGCNEFIRQEYQWSKPKEKVR